MASEAVAGLDKFLPIYRLRHRCVRGQDQALVVHLPTISTLLYSHYPLSQSWQPGYTSLAEADPAFDTQVERVIKRARDGTCLVRWKVTYSFFVVVGCGA